MKTNSESAPQGPADTAAGGCPSCGGSTWLIVEEGGREVARRCHCYRTLLRQRALELAGIKSHYRERNIEGFDAYSDELKAARKVSKDFIAAFPAAEKGLLFVGPTGTGKTHLAAAILVACMDKCRIKGHFCDYRELIRSIQDSYNPQTEATEMSVIRPVLEADLLVMDELGALRPTQWVRDTISYILNNRYAGEKLTLFTTNFALDRKKARDLLGEKDNEIMKLISDARLGRMSDGEIAAEYKEIVKAHYQARQELSSLQDRVGEQIISRIYETCEIVPFFKTADYRLRSSAGRRRSGR